MSRSYTQLSVNKDFVVNYNDDTAYFLDNAYFLKHGKYRKILSLTHEELWTLIRVLKAAYSDNAIKLLS